jgi:predicted DsbA family dithiol-disulfide isomerase
MEKVRLEIFSDYVCPFCWLAEPAVRELARHSHDLDIVRRAFELRPDPVPTLDPGGEYLDRVWRDSVYPLSDRLGVTMRLPPVQPRSRRAHEAARWAGELSRFDAYNEAVFQAFFERGENIGEVDVLVGVAHELGLDGDALRVALERRDYESAVLKDECEAKNLAIGSVPTFVAGRVAMLSGVQPVENLKELIACVREKQPFSH